MPQPQDLHEWVSFEDPTEQRTWTFDVTFLASSYSCIFGRGCKGVLTEDATNLNQGCCSYGAHFTDAADLENLLAHASRLTADQWQHMPTDTWADDLLCDPLPVTELNEDNVQVTTLVEDACIFLNRPGFAGGAGCALHIGAVEASESFVEWKPEVCWQVPLRREETTDAYGWVTTTVREWKRRDWGSGGAEFHWWCTDTPDAFEGKGTVWKSMAEEISALSSPWAYQQLVKYFEKGRKRKSVPLPHPAVRRK
jgi:hypothetical protein